MSPWQAALIPLAIIAVLGSIAFFIGYRNLLSNDRPDDTEPAPATLRPARPAGQGTTLTPAEVAARRNELRAKIAVSDRLTARASQEQAILVQFINIAAPGTTAIQDFVTDLRRDFSEHITFVARHFPTNDQARLAAAAIEAADRQGHLIPFLEHLITESASSQAGRVPAAHSGLPATTPAQLSAGPLIGSPEGTVADVESRYYAEMARRLGMDGDEFTRVMVDPTTAAIIDADCAEADRAGITRAPSLILLDGQDHNALTTLQDFRLAVEAAANR
jgi:hypothetical protein